MSAYDRSLQVLAASTRQVTKAMAEFTRSSSRLSLQNTSTLFGVAGGFVGLTVAYVLSLSFPVSLIIVAFLLSALGISGGVLLYRLVRGIDVERRLDLNRMAVDEVLDRIKSLPRNAPDPVREQLWVTYQALNTVPQFVTQATATRPPRLENESGQATKDVP
jgi:hypothetical protein